MTRNFNDFIAELPPERQKKIEARAAVLIAEYRAHKKTQGRGNLRQFVQRCGKIFVLSGFFGKNVSRAKARNVLTSE
ncbi:MAG: hypothetical protein QM537_01220 [Candidatus Symbiobacter sp.]|nr:hypothetical protein [Candidatus Symbiobacter sp.]